LKPGGVASGTVQLTRDQVPPVISLKHISVATTWPGRTGAMHFEKRVEASGVFGVPQDRGCAASCGSQVDGEAFE
jgi:hypothetical protein